MSKTAVDARGLSCPQPVLLAVQAMKGKGSGEIEVLVDNEASRENVIRAAAAQGWEAAVEAAGGDFLLRLTRK